MQPFDLIKTIAEYGFMTVFAGMALFLAFKYFDQKLSVRSRTVCDLSKHPVFSEIDYLLSYTIPRADFGTVGRSLLFKEMIALQMVAIRDALSSLTSRACAYKSDDEFNAVNVSTLLAAVKAYESAWTSSGVPTVAKKAFSKWHSSRIKIFPAVIDSIARSGLYDSYDEKQWAVCDAYRFLLIITMLDCESTLCSLNGSISGKIFQGEVI